MWCYGAPHLWIIPFYHNTLELPTNCFGLVVLWISSLVPTYVFYVFDPSNVVLHFHKWGTSERHIFFKKKILH